MIVFGGSQLSGRNNGERIGLGKEREGGLEEGERKRERKGERQGGRERKGERKREGWRGISIQQERKS